MDITHRIPTFCTIKGTQQEQVNQVKVPENIDWERISKEVIGKIEFDPITAARHAVISQNSEVEPPQYIMGMRSGIDWVPLMSLGNIALITGKAKVRKTFNNCAIAAAFLVKDEVGGFKYIRSLDTENKDHIAIFDTEQSRYHVQKMQRRVLDLADVGQSEKLHVFGLRRYTFAERVQIIEAVIQENPKLGLILIDGVRDLLSDFNDATASSELVSTLMRWSEDYQMHIVMVLHQNKGDSNARGHLGTEAVNKSEYTLSLERHPKDKSITVVTPQDCRYIEPDPFTFEISEDGLPRVVDDIPELPGGGLKKSKEPSDIDLLTHQEILSSIFSIDSSPTYSDLLKMALNILPDKKINFSKNKTEQLVTYWKMTGQIKTNGKDGTKYCRYLLT